jgi:hypothetical protein
MGKMKGLSMGNAGNGGIMGSGIFGMFGSVVNCKAEDTSTYCEFVKMFNVFIMVLVIVFILYAVYTFTKSTFSNNSGVGRRGR